jgi:hypothetical protein
VWEDVGWIRVDEVWWSGGKYLWQTNEINWKVSEYRGKTKQMIF